MIRSVMSSIIMNKPVIQSGDDVLESPIASMSVHSVHVILEPRQGGIFQIHAGIFDTLGVVFGSADLVHSQPAKQRIEPPFKYLGIGTPSIVRRSGNPGSILPVGKVDDSHRDLVVNLFMELGVHGLQILRRTSNSFIPV
jgi:hypothetical protein